MIKVGGFALLNKYDFSLGKLLSFQYPEHDWDVKQFDTNQRWQDILKNTESRKEFVKELESQLGIQREEDWNKVTQKNLSGIKLPPQWKYYK